MKEKTVTLTIKVRVLDFQAHWLRLTLMDALYEFQSHRGPTEREYVEKRYKESPYLITEEKIEQVKMRKILAEVMRNNIKVKGD